MLLEIRRIIIIVIHRGTIRGDLYIISSDEGGGGEECGMKMKCNKTRSLVRD